MAKQFAEFNMDHAYRMSAYCVKIGDRIGADFWLNIAREWKAKISEVDD